MQTTGKRVHRGRGRGIFQEVGGTEKASFAYSRNSFQRQEDIQSQTQGNSYDVFMEEVAIRQAAMKQKLMLMMLMDEEDSHHQRDRKNEFRHKPRNTKRKFRHDQLNLLTCL
jgi:hypothetical protein